LAMEVLRLVARGLGVDQGFFDPFFNSDPVEVLQLHQYDGEQFPARPEFLESHVDPPAITLIAQDDAGGLESLVGDRWIPVSPVPETLVVQFGTLLARWTNDRYPPSVHRVVSPTTRVRQSIVYSLVPRLDATIECLPSCVDDVQPARYAPTTVARYLEEWASANSAYLGTVRRDEHEAGAVRCAISESLRDRVAAATGGQWSLCSVVRKGD